MSDRSDPSRDKVVCGQKRIHDQYFLCKNTFDLDEHRHLLHYLRYYLHYTDKMRWKLCRRTAQHHEMCQIHDCNHLTVTITKDVAPSSRPSTASSAKDDSMTLSAPALAQKSLTLTLWTIPPAVFMSWRMFPCWRGCERSTALLIPEIFSLRPETTRSSTWRVRDAMDWQRSSYGRSVWNSNANRISVISECASPTLFETLTPDVLLVSNEVEVLNHLQVRPYSQKTQELLNQDESCQRQIRS